MRRLWSVREAKSKEGCYQQSKEMNRADGKCESNKFALSGDGFCSTTTLHVSPYSSFIYVWWVPQICSRDAARDYDDRLHEHDKTSHITQSFNDGCYYYAQAERSLIEAWQTSLMLITIGHTLAPLNPPSSIALQELNNAVINRSKATIPFRWLLQNLFPRSICFDWQIQYLRHVWVIQKARLRPYSHQVYNKTRSLTILVCREKKCCCYLEGVVVGQPLNSSGRYYLQFRFIYIIKKFLPNWRAWWKRSIVRKQLLTVEAGHRSCSTVSWAFLCGPVPVTVIIYWRKWWFQGRETD